MIIRSVKVEENDPKDLSLEFEVKMSSEFYVLATFKGKSPEGQHPYNGKDKWFLQEGKFQGNVGLQFWGDEVGNGDVLKLEISNMPTSKFIANVALTTVSFKWNEKNVRWEYTPTGY